MLDKIPGYVSDCAIGREGLLREGTINFNSIITKIILCLQLISLLWGKE